MNVDIVEVPVCIVVDSDGNYAVSGDVDTAVELHADNNGTVNAVDVFSFKVKMKKAAVKELGTIDIPLMNAQMKLQLVATAN